MTTRNVQLFLGPADGDIEEIDAHAVPPVFVYRSFDRPYPSGGLIEIAVYRWYPSLGRYVYIRSDYR